MVDFKVDIVDKNIDIKIALDNVSLDGGVYMFLLDGIPLYIGETSIFLSRLSQHLYELKNEASYFGLSNLNENHLITYIILKSGLPYSPDEKRKLEDNLRRTPDKNRLEREQEQNKFIDEYHPLTQNPLLKMDSKIDLSKEKKRKKDSMIKDGKTKNKIVTEILAYPEQYNNIKKVIKDKYCDKQ